MEKNNKILKSPAPDKVKKHMGYVVPVVFVIGIVLGFAISNIEWSKSNHRNTKYQNRGSTPEKKEKLPFINPISYSQQYKNLNRARINGLEQKLHKYIAKKTTKNTEEISVYFRDLSTDYFFGINEHSQFSPSSLMKVPVMIAVLKKAETSPDLLNALLLYQESRENKLKNMSESTKKLETMLVEGQSYTVTQLLQSMIWDSDNEATFLLLDFITEEYIHEVEKDLGFVIEKNAVFYSDIITVRQYSSFFRTLYNASYLNNTMSNYALELLSHARYGYGIRKEIPATIQVAHKYGNNGFPVSDHELKVNQLHHFGIIYLPEKPFLLGIMTRGDNEIIMEEHIREITKIVYDEVIKIKNNTNSYLERDIE